MRRILSSFIFALTIASVLASAQGTSFTYQGQLIDGGVPANGAYDLEFRLWSAVSGGSQIGTTQTVLAAPVSAGIFTVTLNFGANFPGAARFLEIAVRPAGQGSYTVLGPRQPVTSSPYAVRATNSGTADALSPSCTLCVTDAQISAVGAGKLDGAVAIANGGTGAPTAAEARINLGLGSLSTITPTGTPDATSFLRGDNTWSPGPVGPQGPAGPVDIVGTISSQFSQDDIAGWTLISTLGDDTCFPSIPLGFAFTGWGLSVEAVSVSSNGVLFFGQNCSSSFTNTSLPSAISIDPFLAFFWDDLYDYGANEFIQYATTGSPGGRVFNMYFRSRLLSSACGTNPVNLMISVHESSNAVVVSYSGLSGCANLRGSSATFGMQGPGGAAAKTFVAGVNAPILDDNAPRTWINYLPPRQ